jgi:serine/threonine-protein phosphatase 2A regulatory subunit B''
MKSVVVANAKLEELLVRWLTQSDEFSQLFEQELDQVANGTWTAATTRSLPSQTAESPPTAPLRSKMPVTPGSGGKRHRKSFTATPPRPLATLIDDLSKTMSALPKFYQGQLDEPTNDDVRLLGELQATIGDLTMPLTLEDFEMVSKVCGLCSYFAPELYMACGGTTETGVWAQDFISFWSKLSENHHDLESKLVNLMNPEEGALTPDDWRDMVTYVLNEHPGLEFLSESPEYHERYVDTVIARIYYACDRLVSSLIQRVSA